MTERKRAMGGSPMDYGRVWRFPLGMGWIRCRRDVGAPGKNGFLGGEIVLESLILETAFF
jgi:hypothetical protein